jgi:hypothetical protein
MSCPVRDRSGLTEDGWFSPIKKPLVELSGVVFWVETATVVIVLLEMESVFSVLVFAVPGPRKTAGPGNALTAPIAAASLYRLEYGAGRGRV